MFVIQKCRLLIAKGFPRETYVRAVNKPWLRNRQVTRTNSLTLKAMQKRNLCSQVILFKDGDPYIHTLCGGIYQSSPYMRVTPPGAYKTNQLRRLTTEGLECL